MSFITEEFIQFIIVLIACVCCLKMYLAHEQKKSEYEQEQKTIRAEAYARQKEMSYRAEMSAMDSGFDVPQSEDMGQMGQIMQLLPLLQNPQVQNALSAITQKKSSESGK